MALAAPLLLFPTVRPRLTVAALAALILVWLLRWAVRREPWPVTPFNGALLLLALTIPVAVWASAFPDLTLPKAAGLVLGLAAFRAVALAVRDRRSLGWALVVFCLVGVVILGVGAVSAEWPTKVPMLGALTGRIPRLLASLPNLQAAGVNPNQIGGVMACYLPAALALATVLAARVGRAASLAEGISLVRALFLLAGGLVFLGLVGGALVLTQSRSGWLGGAAGVLALGTLWGSSSRRAWVRGIGLALLLLTLLVAAAVVFHLGPQRVGEVLYGMTQEGVGTAVGTVSMQGRVEIWSRALYAIQDFAFTGCGLGTFRRVVPILYPLFLFPPDFDIAHAHNMFLQAALDLGLPGLVSYLALLGLAATTCWRAARASSGWVRGAALGLLAGLVGLHVYGLADALTLGSKPGVAFWFALGLVAALPRVSDAEETPKAAPHAPRFMRYTRAYRWLVAGLLLFLGLALILAAAYLSWRALQEEGGPVEPPSMRLPLYPAAQGVDVRAESPPADSGWVGLLEIVTFTTTQPLADVMTFYATALTGAGWETEMEAGDALSWGGIYTRDSGHSVCLLNAFAATGAESEGAAEVWVSIVCGDKSEPVLRNLP